MSNSIRLRERRQQALARRELDIQKWEKLSHQKDPPEGTLKKLDRAKADVANLYAKLGLKQNG